MAADRQPTLDALRGFAMLWMTAYHFCYDLKWHGWWQADMLRDPFWTWQRTAIVSLFLLCAGGGQALAVAQGQSWARFWRRWGQIAACALVVTVASYVAFPRSFIYFGVLHGMAVMLIVVRLLAPHPRALLVCAVLAIAAPFIANFVIPTGAWPAFLHERFGSVLGLIRVKPRTEDYVPLLPWLGVMALGAWGMQWLLAHRPGWLHAWAQPRWLVRLGQWSLSYYMLHQPVLLGLLWLAGVVLGLR